MLWAVFLSKSMEIAIKVKGQNKCSLFTWTIHVHGVLARVIRPAFNQ